jgi:hypothetical protein
MPREDSKVDYKLITVTSVLVGMGFFAKSPSSPSFHWNGERRILAHKSVGKKNYGSL